MNTTNQQTDILTRQLLQEGTPQPAAGLSARIMAQIKIEAKVMRRLQTASAFPLKGWIFGLGVYILLVLLVLGNVELNTEVLSMWMSQIIQYQLYFFSALGIIVPFLFFTQLDRFLFFYKKCQ